VTGPNKDETPTKARSQGGIAGLRFEASRKLGAFDTIE
jgi:hypothetical protein